MQFGKNNNTKKIFITGTDFYVPDETVSNEELVHVFNNYAENFNKKFQNEINLGSIEKIKKSDSDFIVEASGIKNRYFFNKTGILDSATMRPQLKQRANYEWSLQCEMSVNAARKALANAHKTTKEIDGVIVACSNMQRAYPAIAIEVQEALGITGWAYDLNAACSSATFGITAAVGAIKSGIANSILVISPEIYSGHLNFCDRKNHFIFGDGCSATIIENNFSDNVSPLYEILSGRIYTKLSNNIRNNFGFLNRCEIDSGKEAEKLFVQNGRKVIEEIVPLAASYITQHLNDENISIKEIKRLWLHQANIHMNKTIAKLVLGREPKNLEAPIILSEFGNTGASGVMIAFNKYNTDLNSNDLGIICSFGAGYSIGSIIVKKI